MSNTARESTQNVSRNSIDLTSSSFTSLRSRPNRI